MDWLVNNISTIIVSIVLLGVVLLIIRNMRKNNDGCGGSCGDCGSSAICHSSEIGNPLVNEYHKDHVRQGGV